MMKLLFLLFVINSWGQEMSSDFEAPGGIWWHKTSFLTVEKEIHLNAPLLLRADQIVIKDRIWTEGYPLEIEARKLVFEKNGSIETFSGVLDKPPTPVLPNSIAPPGALYGGKGFDGISGPEGFAGKNGMGADGVLPGEINVFAGDIDGTATIRALGQQGGVGGDGGTGQKGGVGAMGVPANSVIGPLKNKRAGAGGKGGSYGKGGKGGNGGQGGSAVPVCLLSSKEWKNDQKVECVPGKGGAAGAPGKPGAAGEGGPGGPGSRRSAFWGAVTATEPGGPAGPAGDACADPSSSEASLGSGELGKEGPRFDADFWKKHLKRSTPLFTASFSDLEQARYDVTKAWYEFHWWRMFEFLTRASFEFLNSNKNQDSIGELLGKDIDSANLEVVSDAWEKHLLKPLKEQYSSVPEEEISLRAKFNDILSIAEPISKTLHMGKQRGALNKNELLLLLSQNENIKKRRIETAVLAINSCSEYIKNVLVSDKYKEVLRSRQTYFDIPVCQTPQIFLTQQALVARIETANSYILKDLNFPTGIIIEKRDPRKASLWIPNFIFLYDLVVPTVSADDKPIEVKMVWLNPSEVSLHQVREFIPKPGVSTVLGSLGVHRGYVMPSRKPTLSNLADQLRTLIWIVR